MFQLKRTLRKSVLGTPYLWAAGRYRALRKLFRYPKTARVGVVDYDDYWDKKAQAGMGKLTRWRLRRAQVFAALVAPGDRVLDLGVGDGALLKYIIEQRGVVGYGLDVSPKAVEFCRAQGLNVDLADVNRPISETVREPFDYVILSEIIEHLPDPESLLDSLRPIVRKAILVSIPNTGFYHHRLRLLFGRFPLQWVVTPGEHLRFWTRADFHWWARQIGFRIAHEAPYEGTQGLKSAWPSLFAAAFVFALEDTRRRPTEPRP